MPPLVIFILAFSPGIFWLWLIYTRDKYRPEPRNLVIKTFLYGAAIAIPVSLIEFILYPNLTGSTSGQPINISTAAYVSFIVAGVTEEIGKYTLVRYTIYKSPYFDEPMDGIIYASAAALGFASLENAGYLFSYGWEVILVRGPFSTLAHVLFSATWGYLLGKQKFQQKTSHNLIISGLIVAIMLHGTFDFLILSQRGLELAALILFIAGAVLFIYLINLANKQSPYKDMVALILVRCAACGHKSGYFANFCNRCGAILSHILKQTSLYCSKCGAPLAPQSHFCNSCGSHLNRKLVKGTKFPISQ